MIIRAVILFVFLTVTTLATAQVSSKNNRFSIAQNKGCDDFTVTVNAPECTGSFSCSADFVGNGSFVTLFDGDSFTYDTPGSYQINIVFATTGEDELDLVVTPNVAPTFDLYSCGGNGVQVKVTDTSYDEYVIDYNDGTIVTVPKTNPVSTHNFASAGSKNVTVRGRNNNALDNCNSNSKPFDAVAALAAPTITQLSVVDNSQVTLNFSTQANVLYRLEIATNNGNTFQPLATIYNDNDTTIANLKTDDNFYCFRLAAFDPCVSQKFNSNIVCSSNFDVAVSNNINQLTWSTASIGVTNYSIFKTPGASVTASANATSYADQDVVCGTEYCYQLQTNYSNGSSSVSLQKCATAISNDIPPAIENISAFIDNNSIGIKWPQDPSVTGGEYEIFKSQNGIDVSIGSTNSPSFTDPAYSLEAQPCYKVSFTDLCNNTSPVSNEVCPIILAATLGDDNATSLNWTSFEGWTNGVKNYVIEIYNDAGLVTTVDAGTNTNYVVTNDDFTNQVFRYRIVANANELGLTQSISNTVTLIKNPNLFYPTAFTPNSDGLNDVFLVFGQYITKFEMKIFNRWGELLYFTTELSGGWDGTFKGSKMPEGTYVFRAKITDQAGRNFERSGTIVLLKK
jgi:gliding motility-associated-like protein